MIIESFKNIPPRIKSLNDQCFLIISISRNPTRRITIINLFCLLLSLFQTSFIRCQRIISHVSTAFGKSAVRRRRRDETKMESLLFSRTKIKLAVKSRLGSSYKCHFMPKKIRSLYRNRFWFWRCRRSQSISWIAGENYFKIDSIISHRRFKLFGKRCHEVCRSEPSWVRLFT